MSACFHTAPAALPTLALLGGAGTGEILVVLLVLLLLFGARRLPELARSLGRAIEEFRRTAQDLTRDVMTEPPPAGTPPAPEDQTTPDDELPPAKPAAPEEYQG